MLHKIDHLRVLFLGNREPGNENIRQTMSDSLHCPVFFDTAQTNADYEQLVKKTGCDIILADRAQRQFRWLNILGSAASSGIPVVFLMDAAELDDALELIAKGAAGCVPKNDAGQLALAVFTALSGRGAPGRQGYVTGENAPLMEELLDNLTDAFYVVDRDWKLKYLNRRAEKCWECRREEMVGRSFWECFPHVAHMPGKEFHDLAMNERLSLQWETASPDFKNWADMRTYPTKDGGLAVFFRDITEKKHAEAVLRVSRERQAILLRLSDSLRLLDNPYDIQEAAARLIGMYLGVETAFYCDVVTIDGVEYFSLENIYSVTDTHIPLGLHSIDSPGVLANENHEGRNIVVCDMESDPRITEERRPSLREHRLSAWISVPLIRNGKFVASFTVHQSTARTWTTEEISLIEETTARTWAEVDRVRAEAALRKSEQHALGLVAELENADRNKNEFINSLSHELRNPLGAIVASLSMLDILDQNPETIKPKQIIKRQTDQLCHLVDDLLDLTRITNNKIQLNLENFDLGGLAQSLAYDHRTLFEEKGVDFGTDISAEPLYISADPVRMSQIIGNLLNNAYKFTEKGGRTYLYTYRQDNRAVIVVKDTGVGIEPSFLPDIFKTFRQAEQNKGGLGLGLSIVKGIVELHGGTVTAESAGLNRGSTFTVSLPLSQVPSVRQAKPASDEQRGAKRLRILLIDDNRDLVETTCALLTLYGYDVASAYSGLGGIEKAGVFRPHVILCDIGLPDIDGYEVARRLTRRGDPAGSRLISLSGYAQASDFDDSREAGFDLHITKPVDFENLKTILDSIPV
jgi:PAS domain S-box-containing protein